MHTRKPIAIAKTPIIEKTVSLIDAGTVGMIMSLRLLKRVSIMIVETRIAIKMASR
jgi:hypothetical protein